MFEATADDIIPSWMNLLEVKDPNAAKRMRAKPAAITRFDQFMSGVCDDEAKVATILLAYRTHHDPDDPTWLIMANLFKLRDIVTQNLDDAIPRITAAYDSLNEGVNDSVARLQAAGMEQADALRTVADETRQSMAQTGREFLALASESASGIQKEASNAREQIKASADEFFEASNDHIELAVASLGKVREAIAAEAGKINETAGTVGRIITQLPRELSNVLEGVHASCLELASKSVDETARQTIVEAAAVGAKGIGQGVEDVKNDILEIRRLLQSAVEHAKRLSRDATIAIGGWKVHEGSLWAIAVSSTMAFVFGAATMMLLSNMTGFGTSQLQRKYVSLGETYANVFPNLTNACRAEVQRIIRH